MPNYTKTKTPVSKGLCIVRHRAIFPGLNPSIVTAARLNCCVRDGNRCFPGAMGTDLAFVPRKPVFGEAETPLALLVNRGVDYARSLARRT